VESRAAMATVSDPRVAGKSTPTAAIPPYGPGDPAGWVEQPGGRAGLTPLTRSARMPGARG
jgi:hypothetical protein